MIRWIFFDVGNVLLNDDPQTYHIHRRYYEAAAGCATGYTFDRFLLEREQQVRSGNRWPTQTVLLRYLSPGDLDRLYHEVTEELRGIYDTLHLSLPDVLPLLRQLRTRYRLGIIANQVVQCRASLERRGLLDQFDVVAISEERDLHKPDPALFRWALDAAGAAAGQCVMVGDRHDNDVVPAAELGLHTIWLRWQCATVKGWDPSEPEARAYLESQDREPFYGRVTRHDVCASAVVADVASIGRAVAALEQALEREAPRAG